MVYTLQTVKAGAHSANMGRECSVLGVTVVIPTLNEERNIACVIKELRGIGFSDILVVDGNSKDKTADIVKELGVELIFQNGRGKGDAVRQVFSCAVKGDTVVMMDADGSMNPKELISFIEALKPDVDVVKGSRFMPGGFSEDMTLLRKVGNLFFVAFVNLLSRTKYTDLCYGFAAFKREAVEKLFPSLRSKNFEIEAEIFIKAKKSDLKVVEVPSVELRRKNGKSNLRAFKDGFCIMQTIIRESLKI